MNPKHLHTPVSTRVRCPVCHQAVYSRAGIHPQCAMHQADNTLKAKAKVPKDPVSADPAGADPAADPPPALN